MGIYECFKTSVSSLSVPFVAILNIQHLGKCGVFNERKASF